MKRIQTRTWAAAVAGSLMMLGVSSCKVQDLGNTNFTCDPEILETVGENVPFTVTGEIDKKIFPKKMAAEVKPFIAYGNQQKDTLWLDPMMLRGEKVEGEGQVVNYKEGGVFTYTGNFKYTGEEMNNGVLNATVTVFTPKKTAVTKGMPRNCEKCKVEGSETAKVADGIIHTDKEVSVSALDVKIAPHLYQKEVIMTQSAKLFYLVNSSNLNMNISLNKSNAAKQAMTDLFNFMSENYVIKGIAIDGWASPEGEGDRNDKLAADRATSAEKYFRKQQAENLRDINITANGKGANWDGFVSNIRNASDFKEGNTVLNNINSKNPQDREAELKRMMKQYPEIRKDILPDLRYAEIIVTALEPRYSDGELKEMALATPQDLKVEELLYAATLHTDFDNKATIYESAARQYPDQWNALNNYASVLITRGNFNEAETLLNKANNLKPNQPDILNNLGVVAAHKGDFAKAAEYFNQAKRNNADVAYNQAVLGVRNGEYSAGLSAMSSRSCDYNLALTQMLSKDYKSAQKTLDCAKQDSQTLYLKAVVAARTDKRANLLENLGQAIQQNASLKATAAADAEFAKYREDADFQALVK